MAENTNIYKLYTIFISKMVLFKKSQENRIKCGRCETEFDLNKNDFGCPLCKFGNESFSEKETIEFIPIEKYPRNEIMKISPNFLSKEKIDINVPEIYKAPNYLPIPPKMNLKSGEVFSDEETRTWGSWLMFNDFFAPKFLARVLAWKLNEENGGEVRLDSLMEDSIGIIKKNKLSKLKGFPNLKKDPNGNRLVNHFLMSATKMGFFNVMAINSKTKDVWRENWKNVKITLTKEGLNFARLKNPIFDGNQKDQVLSMEESEWLINHLKQIDKKGYREYTNLKEVYDFLKAGNNGNKDLWKWFEDQSRFRKYIKERSKKARESEEAFNRQLSNYAKTFTSAKISLLRELGIIKNKRNDYAILEELK